MSNNDYENQIATLKAKLTELEQRLAQGQTSHEPEIVDFEVQGFRVDDRMITNKFWHEVMGTEMPEDDKPLAPKVNITFYEMLKFCNARSEREGFEPAYKEIDGVWHQKVLTEGYLIPSEAQYWIYATNAGEMQSPEPLADYAVFQADEIADVCTKQPIGQIYDPIGNAYESCT